ncbi:MAG: dicarboxylate/amino acid:cation symporter [Acidobacteriota bacterium]|nr:dicarboxylate/amino acid:cation symporter [Acidobacteriota bacterium]
MSDLPDPAPHSKPRKGPKTSHILGGLILGAASGVAANLAWGKTAALANIVHYGTEPAGQMWLRALIMVVIPLVFSRLSLGVAGLGDLRKLGRVGLKTMLFFLMVTTLAAVLGLTLVNLVRPGAGLPAEARDRLVATYHSVQSPKDAAPRGEFGIQTLVNVVPRNPLGAASQGDMLGVIFFSLAFGVALAVLPPERTKVLVEALRGLGDVMIVIIDLVMTVAPYGVFALLFTVAARFGLDLLARLGLYIVTVVVGLAIFEFGVYPILIKVFTGWSPWLFFRRAWTAILTGFSTSSSNATLPTTLEVCEESLGLPREVCGFVVPLGATMCMNGTALFEGVTVLFIAQVFGIHLNFSSQIVVMVTAILMSIGAAGVPSGGIQVLFLVLESVGIPGEGIAMVVGVDRLLDMCRVVVNVTGDMVAATYVARSEGKSARPV